MRERVVHSDICKPCRRKHAKCDTVKNEVVKTLPCMVVDNTATVRLQPITTVLVGCGSFKINAYHERFLVELLNVVPTGYASHLVLHSRN